MITRRQVVQGAIAVAAVATIGMPAIASSNADKLALLESNVRRELLGIANQPQTKLHMALAEQLVQLNVALVRDNPDIFDLNYVMRGPVDLMPGQTIATEAVTRKLSARIAFDEGLNKRVSDELFNVVYHEIAAEYRAETRQHPEKMMCAYVPVTSSGILLNNEGQYVVHFLTRYGICNRT